MILVIAVYTVVMITLFSVVLPVSADVKGMAGVPASRSASLSSWEAKEDGVLLRDDDGQASVGSKVRLRSGRVLDARTRSLSYSSAARRSTFLYLKDRVRDNEASVLPCLRCDAVCLSLCKIILKWIQLKLQTIPHFSPLQLPEPIYCPQSPKQSTCSSFLTFLSKSSPTSSSSNVQPEEVQRRRDSVRRRE